MSRDEWIVAGLVFLTVTALTALLVWASRQALRKRREVFAQETRAGLAEMFIFADPAFLWRVNLAASLLVPLFLWLFTGSLPVTVAAAVLVALAPRLILRHLRKRRLARMHEQLPDTLLMTASALRGGANLGQTLEGLSRDLSPPMSQELSLVVREQRLGATFEEAVAHLAERVPSQDMELVVAALRINREVGGNLADTLHRLGDTVRRRLMMEQKIKALTAQGKLQGLVMTALPVLIILALLRIEPQAAGALFHTYQGWAVLAIAVVLEFLGYLGIRKITTIEV